MNPLRNAASRALVLLPVLVLSGCASTPPARYYTLIAPNAYAAPTPATAPGYAIDVEPVSVPAQVDQTALVLRQSDGQLAIVDTHLWAAPLVDEIRDALSADLAARLSVPELHGASATPDTRVWKIAVDVQRFDSRLAQQAALVARWSLRNSEASRPALVCSSSIEIPVGPGWPALIEGHQRALGALADRIASSLRSLQGGTTASCPG